MTSTGDTSKIRKDNEPICAGDQEYEALREVERILDHARAASQHARLSGPGEESLEIPGPMYRLLRQVIPHLLRGDAVALVPVHRQLTTQEAADYLNMSRPHLVKLLNEEALPYTMVGTHRRIAFRDVLAYRRKRDTERDQALSEMTALADEYGMYD